MIKTVVFLMLGVFPYLCLRAFELMKAIWVPVGASLIPICSVV